MLFKLVNYYNKGVYALTKTIFLGGYMVEFDFYFLDEDGYCLKEISTKNQKSFIALEHINQAISLH